MKYTRYNCCKLKELIEKNPHLKMKEIAELFGCQYKDVNALASYCKISYLKIRNKAILDDYINKKSIKEISKKYNVSVTTVYRILDANGLDRDKRIKKFNPKINSFMKRLEECNYSIKKTAELYNVDESTLRKYVKKRKLSSLIKNNNARSKSHGLNLKHKIINYLESEIKAVFHYRDTKIKLYDLLQLRFGGRREYIRKVVNKWIKEKQWEEKKVQKNKE